ncbi:MAG: hypothetical protein U0791_12390 [Gemmataceae bacterium]
MFRSLSLAGFFATILFAIGCSGSDAKKVTLKGKLVEGGAPYVLNTSKLKMPPGASLPPGARPLTVSFIPAGGGDTAFANVELETGAFTVSLVPGKYKIAVVASAGMGAPDLFGGKYSSEKTQIQRDLAPDTEIVIDLSKPQG